MSRDIRYIGMDVHKEAIIIAVLNGRGQLVMESIVARRRCSTTSVWKIRFRRITCCG
jgi:hypothetical protein